MFLIRMAAGAGRDAKAKISIWPQPSTQPYPPLSTSATSVVPHSNGANMSGSKTSKSGLETSLPDFKLSSFGKQQTQLRQARETSSSLSEVFLTEQELAARHRRSVKTLRNARVSGTYVKFVRIGRSIRYRLSDVIEYKVANLMRSTSGIAPK